MIRISTLLFATTIVTIFAYLLIFTSFSAVGNGGEYWGFDGRVEPHVAAAEAYDAGRYELLALEMRRQTGNLVKQYPRRVSCRSRGQPVPVIVRLNSGAPLHGPDSVRLASQFAEAYNRAMTNLIVNTFGYRCEKRL